MSHDWMTKAVCRNISQFTELAEEEAIPLCVGCPVRLACLRFAIDTHDVASARYSVTYGGVTSAELVRMVSEQNRPQRLSPQSRQRLRVAA